MSSYDALPVILVSAADEAAASTIISEIIDNEPADLCNVDSNSKHRVWRIENKYYTADVRFHALIDNNELIIRPETIEGHIIYLAEDECTVDVAAARASHADAAGVCADVRLVLARATTAPAALYAWAAGAHAELVPLAEPAPAATDGPFPELSGIPRVRAALHAHVWTGLRSQRHRLSPRGGRSSESSSGGSSEEESEEEEVALERIERFAAALGTLASAAPHTAAMQDTDRRLAAEHFVTQFCRVLGRNRDAF